MTISGTIPRGMTPQQGTVPCLTKPAYTFFIYNAHLFGKTGTAEYRDKNGTMRKEETGLVYKDEDRASQICARIRKNPRDVVGFNEVWDEELGNGIENSLKDIYPYRVRSPYAQGIQEIVGKWPMLSRCAGWMVHCIGKGHYNVGGGLYCFNENWLRVPRKLLGIQNFLGAGLLLLSRYPIESSEFIPYSAKAGLGEWVQKGIIEAAIRFPHDSAVTVALTHLQEGTSMDAKEARGKQLNQLAAVDADVDMGDFNIKADQTREYQWAQRQLGLIDSYRVVHPDPVSDPGYTYEHNSPKNPYADKLGVKSAPGEGSQRIDLMFAKNKKFRPLSCRVPAEEFISDEGDYFLSDHHPVEATFAEAL